MAHQIFNKKNYLSLLIIGLIFAIGILTTPRVALAQSCDTFDPDDPQIVHILCPFVGVINALVLSAGGVFVIVIIFGSYKYATAQGDPRAAMGAQKTVTYAVIGLIAIVGVFVMLNVIGNIFGFDESLTTSEGVFERINNVICAFLENGDPRNPIVCVQACGCTP